ncbi:molybdopterin molybdotransferase MoeA [Martelella soudanensis]|uniref:molybdopterin molybdotransferase MoeA n=1 Tax=unclassified Martelella TaxID=2629616 RepID=UPI0015E02283|nr:MULTISPECIES: gephyrin-like molybdotransferase Glp [unclassified Martelella]
MADPLLSVEDAGEILLEHAPQVDESETVALSEADGRVLAEDVASRITQPPFAASAMDGYAVRAADIGPKGAELQVIGEIAAGAMSDAHVTAGTAMRIFTGAPVPQGADCVVIQENTERRGDANVFFKAPASAGDNIRNAGQDFAAGDILLRHGRLLNARALSLAASAGHGTLSVFRRPRVAVLATGNELVPPGTLPGPGQISASGSVAIAALARGNGADVIDLGIAGDTEADIRRAVEKAVEASADILITIGGASVGDHDLIRPTLSAMGMELDFWKIAMRPGKPLMVGRLADMRVLGLPGNPVSSFVCALVFAEPLIRHIGRLKPLERETSAIAASALAENGPRQHYMRGCFDADGRVEIFERQDSSLQATLADADCLIIRPPFAAAVDAGQTVRIAKLG